MIACLAFRLCACLVLAGLILSAAQAVTITVKPGESIQKAIDEASDGDIIEILAGTYNESINVTKSLVLRAAPGAEKPLLNSGGHRDVVSLLANETRLEGLSLVGADDIALSGIRVLSHSNVIVNNSIRGNCVGVHVASSDNIIAFNEIEDNYLGGMILFLAQRNTVSNNCFFENNQNGIMTHQIRQ